MLFLLVSFLTTEQIIPLAPLIKSHAKAQYHFEMLAFSLKFITGLHHTVIFSTFLGLQRSVTCNISEHKTETCQIYCTVQLALLAYSYVYTSAH